MAAQSTIHIVFISPDGDSQEMAYSGSVEEFLRALYACSWLPPPPYEGCCPAGCHVVDDLVIVTAKWRTGERLPHRLTARHIELLKLLAEGQTSAQIAEALSISTPTVNKQIYRIKQRLGVTTRAEMISKAAKIGVI